ncbi:MAG: hypothetical protein RLZZ337_1528 [Bacteroidota bacterium]|jgi:1-aminocyclopropane-1-carboxylate deaminase
MIQAHLNIPSPCHQVKTDWQKEAGVELWIKRDDLIHPIISGNKWRKLSGIISAYQNEKYESIVTFGGAFSNHLVATACATAILGITAKAIIRGEEPKERNTVLQLCALYGMQLEFVSREAYRETCRKTGIENGVLYIPEGGACTEGTIGCKSILAETDLTGFSQIFVSCGTGTTIAGMAIHLAETNNSIQLNGIQVLKGTDYIKNELATLYQIDSVVVYDEFHCGGYAKTTTELIDFSKDFTIQTGIVLDPIYTSKMFLGIRKLVEEQKIERGEKLLAVHTGGLTGWFGKFDELKL